MFLAEIVQQSSPVIVQSGVGLGSMLAITFSWARNRSIFWAIVAALLSWFYVIYFALTRRPNER
jgi:hypothetical protein